MQVALPQLPETEKLLDEVRQSIQVQDSLVRRIRTVLEVPSSDDSRSLSAEDRRALEEQLRLSEETAANLHRRRQEIAQGGSDTTRLLAEAARSLASAAAALPSGRGSINSSVGASAAMGSNTPLIDIDGREYTGFLEKKKAAENLEFTTFFRRWLTK